jgi:hypothetical protein
VLAAGGSISHHHGVGKLRLPFVPEIMSPAMIEWRERLKAALDPDGVFAAQRRCTRIHPFRRLDDDHGASGGARVLLTGCTGFVGKVVLEELLRRRDELGVEAVHLLIRPRAEPVGGSASTGRRPSPCFSRLEPGWRDLCHPVAGDITEAGLGSPPDDAERLAAR